MTRERDRYGRASIAERIGGLWEAFRANRTAQVVVAVALGVVLALRLVSPQGMGVPDPRVGGCGGIRGGTPAGAPYPGQAALLERELGRCLEVFQPFVGRALEGSIYDTTVVVPGADGWSGGDRHGVCLIVLRNGRFMDGQARGRGTENEAERGPGGPADAASAGAGP